MQFRYDASQCSQILHDAQAKSRNTFHAADVSRRPYKMSEKCLKMSKLWNLVTIYLESS